MDTSTQTVPTTSKVAWTALLVSLGGIVLWPGLSLVAVLLGGFAWWEIHRRPQQLSGRAQALVGIVLGLLNLAFVLWIAGPHVVDVNISLPR